MCGIVFVGGPSLVKYDVSLFEKMLFCDTFRGPHSTGVFTKRYHTVPGQTEKTTTHPFVKLAVEGPEFVQSADWEDLRDGFGSTTSYNNFYVGHNRYATVGAINATNAHPFREGKITMVHNGTLLDQSILPDHENYEVDSNNVAHALNVWGVDKTIQNLDGAFTLIWHNSETETLHIIRNDERPFHLAKSKAGKWYGASEEGMLMWLLGRGKSHQNPDIVEHFECKVGVEYVFSTADQGFSFVEERKHELPVFPAYNRYGYSGTGYTGSGYGGGYGTGYNAGGGAYRGGASTYSKDTVSSLFQKHGVKGAYGQQLKFNAFEFEAYNSTTVIQRGKVVGFLDHNDYIEVICHSVAAMDYTHDTTMWGEVMSAYEKMGVLTVVVRGATQTDPFTKGTSGSPESSSAKQSDKSAEGGNVQNNVVVADHFDEDVFIDPPSDDDDRCPWGTEGGDDATMNSGAHSYTRSEWAKHWDTDCAYCSSPIEFAPGANIAQECGSPLCEECDDALTQREESFNCSGCGYTCGSALQSPFPGVCKDCYESYWPNDEEEKQEELDVDDMKVLRNGLIVNEEYWVNGNDVCSCGNKVAFEDCDQVNFAGGKPVCAVCQHEADEYKES